MLPEGLKLVAEGGSLLLKVHDKSEGCTTASIKTATFGQAKPLKIGKGTHGLTIVRQLLVDKENWKTLASKRDYQYLGVFTEEQTQCIYYVADCTKLAQASMSDQIFFGMIF